MTNEEPRIDVILDGPEWLVLQTSMEGLIAAETLTWFTDAAKLNTWWGDEALIEPRPGGLYKVSWPLMDWTMRGVVAHCTSDTLIYSWTWEHEPDQPSRSVVIHAESNGSGSVLTITHGPYRPESPVLTDEDSARHSHREGWLFFLAELHATMGKSPSDRVWRGKS
jgi:uncharacterized protein YndB with AHSA1/START domain